MPSREGNQTTSEAVSDPVEDISQAAPKPPIEQPVAQDSPNIVASTEPQSYLNSHGLESLGDARPLHSLGHRWGMPLWQDPVAVCQCLAQKQ
ncbi:MAG: hypothetical protein ACFBSF_07685 [Leptolyngbyaceae cyanobacterium]